VCKKTIKNSQPFVKKIKKCHNLRTGIFLTHTVYVCVVLHIASKSDNTSLLHAELTGPVKDRGVYGYERRRDFDIIVVEYLTCSA